MTGFSLILIAFFLFEIIFGSLVTLWQTKVEMNQRSDWCKMYLIQYKWFSQLLINQFFLSCLAFKIFGHQWPCGIQSVLSIYYKFLKKLNKLFFEFISKDMVFLGTSFVFVFDFQHLWPPVTLWQKRAVRVFYELLKKILFYEQSF